MNRVNPEDIIKIGNKTIKEGSAFIIAEMACAHDGEYFKAIELIDVAVNSGCDAVQLQFFNTESNVVVDHNLYSLLQKIEFSPEQWSNLVDYARHSGINVFACAYDYPSLELAIDLNVDGIKFNSADLNNIEMLKLVAGSGIVFTLGTGASRMEEIGLALETVLDTGGSNVILMHGMQSFPTAVESANISRIKTLKAAYSTHVGYADHTAGDDPFSQQIDLLAFSMGATVFEKHYTLDRKQKGTDYQAALDPEILNRYVSNLRSAEKAIGSKQFVSVFSEEEINYRQFQKKKIVAARDLLSGEILNREDVKLLRTNESIGIDAGSMHDVIGRKLNRDVSRHKTISVQDLI